MPTSTILASPYRTGAFAALVAGGFGWTGAAFAQSTVPTFGTVAPAPPITYERVPGTNSLAGNDALTTVRNVDRTAAGLSNVRPYCGAGFTVSETGTTCVPDVAAVEPAPVVETYVPPPQPVVVQAPPPPTPAVAAAPPPPPVAPVPFASTGLSNSALVAGGVGVLALGGLIAIIASDNDNDSSSTTTTTP